GALLGHITGGADAETFQPMNVNFGLMPPIEGRWKRTDRKKAYTDRARAKLAEWLSSARHPGFDPGPAFSFNRREEKADAGSSPANAFSRGPSTSSDSILPSLFLSAREKRRSSRLFEFASGASSG